jgi:hypothetical protein
VKPDCAARAAVNPLRAALPTANQCDVERDVVGALGWPTPGARQRQRESKRMRGLICVELPQSRRHGSNAEGR